MSDDLDEFNAAVNSTPATTESDSQQLTKAVAVADVHPRMDDEDREVMANKLGKVTCWSRYGSGWVATTPTKSKLAPGVYVPKFSQGAGWYLDPVDVVTDNLLRLPDSKSDAVIGEIERFWTLKDKFKKFGFVHKRGFLLWGPPGSGKTSTLAVVIKQMVDSGGVVVLGDTAPSGLAITLALLRSVEPERPVAVILEDIDDIIKRFGESEVLAILDGESSIANVVYLATTNYPENLAGRVINRPSRFDKVVKIGMPNRAAREAYLRSRGLDTDIEKWVDVSEGFSVAHLKELIVGVHCLGEELNDVVVRLRKMTKAVKSGEGEQAVGFGVKSRQEDDYDDSDAHVGTPAKKAGF